MATNDARTPVVVPEFARTADKPITIGHWDKKVGQQVNEGDRLLDLLCDKADFEVLAPGTGVLVEKLVTYNVEIQVGDVVGWLDASVQPWVWEPPPGHPTAIGRCTYCQGLLFPDDVRCRNCAALV